MQHPGKRSTTLLIVLFALVFAPVLSGQTSATTAAPTNQEYAPRFPAGIWELTHENDWFIFSDRDYTGGLRLAYTTPNYRDWADVPGWFHYQTLGNFINTISLISEDWATNASGDYAQINIYTPDNQAINPPNPNDYPYSGWVGVGKDFIRQTMYRRAIVEVNVGWVGPDSGAEQLQEGFHSVIGSTHPQGWSHQLKNEPVLQTTYRQDWRVPALTNLDPSVRQSIGYDVIAHGLATFGNGWDYAAVGAMTRFGYQLPLDFGPSRPRLGEISSMPYEPGGSTTADPLSALSAYLCAGAEARAVARDITLDGNTFAHSASVVHKPVVGEVYGGMVMTWGHFRGDFLVLYESNTFRAQPQGGQWRGILTVGCQF
jgi:hypothetical protein